MNLKPLTEKEHDKIKRLFVFPNLMAPKDIAKKIKKEQATVYRSLTKYHGFNVAKYLQREKTKIVVNHLIDNPNDFEGAAELAKCAISTARYYNRNAQKFIGEQCL